MYPIKSESILVTDSDSWARPATPSSGHYEYTVIYKLSNIRTLIPLSYNFGNYLSVGSLCALICAETRRNVIFSSSPFCALLRTKCKFKDVAVQEEVMCQVVLGILPAVQLRALNVDVLE